MEAAPFFPDPQGAELDAVVTAIAAVEREIRGLEGRKRALLAQVRQVSEAVCAAEGRTGRAAELVHRAASAEVGFALGIADRSAEALIERSHDLCTRFSEVHDALSSGRISVAHASAIADAGLIIADPVAREAFTRAAVEVAEAETPNRARRAAKVLAERFAERTLDERCARAAEARRVWVTPLDDGMAELHAVVDAALAAALHDRLTRIAREQVDADAAAAAAGESGERDIGGVVPRTLDQARADLCTELLLNGDPSQVWRAHGGVSGERIDARVQVIVPVSVLTGDAPAVGAPATHTGLPAPAMLSGYGAISADRARLLAGLSRGWDRVAVDHATGEVLAVDRYRPSEELLRYLRARDQHCRFPGCQIVPFRADVDHTHDAARGGATSVVNLAVLCRRHHTMKHHAGIEMTQHPDGAVDWTTPLGRRKRERPPSRVMFGPIADVGGGTEVPQHEQSAAA
ncbi:HNH endonuclease signature motif containing protein [Leucobacter chromiiresistens]|uniref:HNH endonuclease signature motif containing protein n=1 Tax=Leucobacter chromiiresistens TaxID=1079994 RepID=UPI000734ADB0|nr:HNH endonuclease signature motif containing protein [Leucobacter chromiiresistens]